jgi:glycine/D-amino acid oxidase-like deaminating enzyme
MHDFTITIIGAGVIGLALADELSAAYAPVAVLEKNTGYGRETSSRNSEVIHAGVYYPPGLHKSLLCIEGNRLLYEICRKRRIPHRKSGKLIVATDADECGTDRYVPALSQPCTYIPTCHDRVLNGDETGIDWAEWSKSMRSSLGEPSRASAVAVPLAKRS